MECIQHWARLWGEGCRRILVGPCCPETCNVSGRSGKPRKWYWKMEGSLMCMWRMAPTGKEAGGGTRLGGVEQVLSCLWHPLTPLSGAQSTWATPEIPSAALSFWRCAICHLRYFFFLKWRDRIPFLPWYLPGWKFEEALTFYNYIILLFGLVMWESPPARPQSCHPSVHPSIHSPSHLCSESYGAFMICEAL